MMSWSRLEPDDHAAGHRRADPGLPQSPRQRDPPADHAAVRRRRASSPSARSPNAAASASPPRPSSSPSCAAAAWSRRPATANSSATAPTRPPSPPASRTCRATWPAAARPRPNRTPHSEPGLGIRVAADREPARVVSWPYAGAGGHLTGLERPVRGMRRVGSPRSGCRSGQVEAKPAQAENNDVVRYARNGSAGALGGTLAGAINSSRILRSPNPHNKTRSQAHASWSPPSAGGGRHAPGVGGGQSADGRRSTIAAISARSVASRAISVSSSTIRRRSSCSAGSHGQTPVSRIANRSAISRNRSPSRCAPCMNFNRSTASAS